MTEFLIIFFIIGTLALSIAGTIYLAKKKMEGIRDLEEQTRHIRGFTPSQTVLSISGVTALSIDESANLVCRLIKHKEGVAYQVVSASEIVGVELLIRGKSSSEIANRALGGAVIGGLFGNVGSLIGSNVAASKAAADIDQIALILTFNDTFSPNFRITFTASGDRNFRAEGQARKWQSIIEIMARRAASQPFRPPVNSGWVNLPGQAPPMSPHPPARQSHPLPAPQAQIGRAPACELLSAAAQNSYPVRISQAQFTIGRASSNDLILQDAKVSRQHAVLRHAGGRWRLEDANSAGGVFVNQQPVRSAVLSHGDRIRIGSSEFIFREA